MLAACSPASQQSGDTSTQGPLILTERQGAYPLGLHMDILEDPSGELTIQDVVSPEFDSQFKPSTAEIPIYGYTDSAFWLRLNLKNISQLTYQWLLEVIFPNLNYVDLYLPVEGDGYTVTNPARCEHSICAISPTITSSSKYRCHIKMSRPFISASRAALR